EAVMLGLRLREGFQLSAFEQKFDISFRDAFTETVTRMENLGLLAIKNGRAVLTREGLFLADSVILEFITEPEPTI
nr:coproporphyrinogen III oxidase [Nitrospinaceae bacterium]NIR56225.1 coproporphyrinogen III oxidase [Nitrospinaceae bacterium]NIS86681.1 coproporphyrinogen III oxidase [Nitrospinaceae bacterium]NIT83514.1 coproporphyrinogen III oxidase [Nitrospinaceae bacterium]NIU45719.1 coproporphyrinogen III oxidase [Nitrospinaceae bacterium]